MLAKSPRCRIVQNETRSDAPKRTKSAPNVRQMFAHNIEISSPGNTPSCKGSSVSSQKAKEHSDVLRATFRQKVPPHGGGAPGSGERRVAQRKLHASASTRPKRLVSQEQIRQGKGLTKTLRNV
jgi:hypothetical protein